MFNFSILYWDQQTSVQKRRHRNFRNSIPLIFLIFYWYYILRKEKRITLLKFHRFPFQLFFPPFKYCWWMCGCVVGVCVSVSVSKYIKPLDNTVHLAPDICISLFLLFPWMVEDASLMMLCRELRKFILRILRSSSQIWKYNLLMTVSNTNYMSDKNIFKGTD